MFSLESSPFLCWVLISQVDSVQWKEAFGEGKEKTGKDNPWSYRNKAGAALLSCPTWAGAGHHSQLPASWKTGVWRTGAIALTPSPCLPTHQAHMSPVRKGMQS